jgi:hypothetical protein
VLQKRSAREPDKTAKTGKKTREKPVTQPVQAVQLQCLKKKNKLKDYVFPIWWFFINFLIKKVCCFE